MAHKETLSRLGQFLVVNIFPVKYLFSSYSHKWTLCFPQCFLTWILCWLILNFVSWDFVGLRKWFIFPEIRPRNSLLSFQSLFNSHSYSCLDIALLINFIRIIYNDMGDGFAFPIPRIHPSLFHVTNIVSHIW